MRAWGFAVVICCWGVACRSEVPAPAAVAAPSASARAHAPHAGRARTTRAAKAPKAKPGKTAPKSGIQQINATTWEVPRKLVNRYQEDPGDLAAQASVSGVSGGWKVKSVKAGSNVAQLGIRKGDVITEVNGYSLDGKLKTYWAAMQLKGEDNYRVTVKRGGKNQTLKYRVVP